MRGLHCKFAFLHMQVRGAPGIVQLLFTDFSGVVLTGYRN